MFFSATCWNGCRRLSDYDVSTLSAVFVISKALRWLETPAIWRLRNMPTADNPDEAPCSRRRCSRTLADRPR
jgi:hypothetical protein